MASRRVYPLPEIIDPGPWIVKHLDRGGHTIPSKRLLAAPLVDTPFGRGVRTHELCHVAFSPPRLRAERLGISPDALLAVEDARVNELGKRAGLGSVLAVLDDPAGRALDPRDDVRSATLLLVAAHGTAGFLASGSSTETAAVAARRRGISPAR